MPVAEPAGVAAPNTEGGSCSSALKGNILGLGTSHQTPAAATVAPRYAAAAASYAVKALRSPHGAGCTKPDAVPGQAALAAGVAGKGGGAACGAGRNTPGKGASGAGAHEAGEGAGASPMSKAQLEQQQQQKMQQQQGQGQRQHQQQQQQGQGDMLDMLLGRAAVSEGLPAAPRVHAAGTGAMRGRDEESIKYDGWDGSGSSEGEGDDAASPPPPFDLCPQLPPLAAPKPQALPSTCAAAAMPAAAVNAAAAEAAPAPSLSLATAGRRATMMRGSPQQALPRGASGPALAAPGRLTGGSSLLTPTQRAGLGLGPAKPGAATHGRDGELGGRQGGQGGKVSSEAGQCSEQWGQRERCSLGQGDEVDRMVWWAFEAGSCASCARHKKHSPGPAGPCRHPPPAACSPAAPLCRWRRVLSFLLPRRLLLACDPRPIFSCGLPSRKSSLLLHHVALWSPLPPVSRPPTCVLPSSAGGPCPCRLLACACALYGSCAWCCSVAPSSKAPAPSLPAAFGGQTALSIARPHLRHCGPGSSIRNRMLPDLAERTCMLPGPSASGLAPLPPRDPARDVWCHGGLH